jgi:hypothetical protein
MKSRIVSWIGRAFFLVILLLVSACSPGTPIVPTGSPVVPAPATSYTPTSAVTSPTPAPTLTGQPDFQKGMSYASWWQGQYSTPKADQSLANLAATGANWVAVIVTGYQETYTSTIITRDLPKTPTDKDLVHAIAKAHDLGLSVMLKPHVDLSDDPAHWRGDIGTAFTDETQRQAWFTSYGEFINHYATLAQEKGIEQFCVGTELIATSSREEDWREVVKGVRERFTGPITYASNHGGEEASITWWDAVDYIGVDAYYALTDENDPSVDELKAAWIQRGYVDTLADLSKKYDKLVLLTEIGYRSADGTTIAPWEWQSEPAIDLQEQADAYQAALEVLWGQPWLAGIYWWNWDTDPNKGGETDTDFTPHNKPAEEVLKTYYLQK